MQVKRFLSRKCIARNT